MIGFIQLEERGATPRNMVKSLNRFMKVSWYAAGIFYHDELAPKRFTVEHGRKARYTKRMGEVLPFGSKGWKRSYYGRKYRSPRGGGVNRAEPLVFSGATQRAMKVARVSSTSKGVRIRYPGGRGLNRRHPRSRINMWDEFSRFLPEETQLVADGVDATLDDQIRSDNTVTITTVTR